MFERFTLDRIDVGEVTLRVRYGGSGPPIVLLHGHPRTHVTWHRVAPALAADAHRRLPGPARLRAATQVTGERHDFSKRAMAGDIVRADADPRAQRFAVAGHDRGCYVAMRLALDHPQAVTHLAVLDGVPIGEALARADARFAQLWWHWFFLGQTAKPAEPIINADPEAWYRLEKGRSGGP